MKSLRRPAVRPGALNGADELRAKVSHLSHPASYPEQPATVEVVQTHMSCVFLTDRHAWKLKKPVRFEYLDFSTVAARRAHCDAELRLNRRLAPDVYLGVVPLVATGGGYVLAGRGEVVDWLVKMRRLPRRLMLDQALREGAVTDADVRRFTLVLADFFGRAEPVSMEPAAYRKRFAAGVGASFGALETGGYGLPAQLVRNAGAAVRAALGREAIALEHRARGRRIVEGHGDLRPEHVCLEPQPIFIDCLEFNRDWRLLDPADELAYLAMECRHAGVPWIGGVVLAAYRGKTGDEVSPGLIGFYQAYRAALRAKLCAWHLNDNLDPADQGKWLARAQQYLELARQCSATEGT